MIAKTVVKIQGGMSQLHGRPLYERRAMFLACFLILGTAILSLWVNHMYNRFGVAFVNQTREIRVNDISLPGGAGQRVPSLEDAGGLKGPLGVFRENARLVKEGTANLFSALSPFLESFSAMRALPPVLPEENSGLEEKLPPVIQPLSDGSASLAGESPDVSVFSDNEAVPVLDSEVSAGNGVKSEPENLRISETLAEESSASKIVFVEKKDMPQEHGADWQNNSGVAPTPVKKFSPVSVLSGNLAIMSQALGDFFEYLVR